MTGETGAGPHWTAWRVMVGFGLLSLAADMVHEGARSMYGPLLASLSVSALIVGLVTGAARRWRWCCASSSGRSPTAPAPSYEHSLPVLRRRWM